MTRRRDEEKTKRAIAYYAGMREGVKFFLHIAMSKMGEQASITLDEIDADEKKELAKLRSEGSD